MPVEHNFPRNMMAQNFLSHTFKETQQKWSATEQEAYGVYYVVTKWNYYLQGAEMIVRNDHEPLARFLNGKNANNKVNRWGLELATYNITFEWISGACSKAVDCLSCLVELPQNKATTINMLSATHSDGPALHTRSRTVQHTHLNIPHHKQMLQLQLSLNQETLHQNPCQQIDWKHYYKCKRQAPFANVFCSNCQMGKHQSMRQTS